MPAPRCPPAGALNDRGAGRFLGAMSVAGPPVLLDAPPLRATAPEGSAVTVPAAELYLDLLARSLTGLIHPWRLTPAPAPREGGWKAAAMERLSGFLATKARVVAKTIPFNAAVRAEGRDWPIESESMVGLARLDNIRNCVRTAIADGVPGGLIETGVWRGGSCIFMRACLEAFGDTTRGVWVADSFRGLPPPDAGRYPADAGDTHHLDSHALAISRSAVEENFRRYGLLDGRVKFLEGWFADTLPAAETGPLAVVRLDGDMYGSTMDAIEALYPRLSPGGFLIVDDFHHHEPCARAIHDYRAAHRITETIERIDWTGAFWRRSA